MSSQTWAEKATKTAEAVYKDFLDQVVKGNEVTKDNKVPRVVPLDLSTAINHRLSRIAGRDIQLYSAPTGTFVIPSPDDPDDRLVPKRGGNLNLNLRNLIEQSQISRSTRNDRKVQIVTACSIQVQPDSLSIRCNPNHSVLVPIKQMRQGKTAFVIGMSVPLVLMGSENDLRFAWDADLGEKTRNGFGCISLTKQGVGR